MIKQGPSLPHFKYINKQNRARRQTCDQEITEAFLPKPSHRDGILCVATVYTTWAVYS